MRVSIAAISSCLYLCLGCHGEGSPSGQAEPSAPYRLGQALVIGDGESELTNVDDGCDSAACAAVRERCGDDAYADVVVDASGQVLDVLCFRGNAHIEEVGREAVETLSAGNGTVLVLDGEDDGVDVTGDVVLAGNNAVLYGQGVDVSQVGGLSIEKNNAIVRGVTILGDVVISKNNAQLSFCEIRGDLTISGNNTTLAECTVHGQVTIDGVNTVLVNDRFASARTLSGKNLSCSGNTVLELEAEVDAGVDPDADAVDAGASGDGSGSGAADAGAGAAAAVVCEASHGAPNGHGRR